MATTSVQNAADERRARCRHVSRTLFGRVEHDSRMGTRVVSHQPQTAETVDEALERVGFEASRRMEAAPTPTHHPVQHEQRSGSPSDGAGDCFASRTHSPATATHHRPVPDLGRVILQKCNPRAQTRRVCLLAVDDVAKQDTWQNRSSADECAERGGGHGRDREASAPYSEDDATQQILHRSSG